MIRAYYAFFRSSTTNAPSAGHLTSFISITSFSAVTVETTYGQTSRPSVSNATRVITHVGSKATG